MNLELARQNLSWIIQKMEESDAKQKEKDLLEWGACQDGEPGHIFHLKRVLELLE